MASAEKEVDVPNMSLIVAKKAKAGRVIGCGSLLKKKSAMSLDRAD